MAVDKPQALPVGVTVTSRVGVEGRSHNCNGGET